MAMSFGVLGGCLAGETPSLVGLPFSVNGVGVPPVTLRANQQRGARSVTLATASKPAVVAETKRRQPRGIMKPRQVSPEMQAFLGGVTEIPRTQALKEIWAYIKKHDLQDPENKKVIVCDEKLKSIFSGKDRVGFLEIAGLISPHFLK